MSSWNYYTTSSTAPTTTTTALRNRGVPSYLAHLPKQQPQLPKQQEQQCRSMVVVTQTKKDEPVNESITKTDPTSSSPTTITSTPTTTTTESACDHSEWLTITPACLAQVERLLQRRSASPEEEFLRVFVDAGGCSGFTYQFELDSNLDEEDDVVFTALQGKTRVVVDQASLQLIKGSTIDYVQEMIKSAFVVADNPQSESACGCGSSFAIKNFANNPALD